MRKTSKKKRIKNKVRFVIISLIILIILAVAGFFLVNLLLDRPATKMLGVDTTLGAPVTAGLDTKKAKVKNEEFGKPITDTIYIYNPAGRTLKLQMKGGMSWSTEAKVKLPDTVTAAGADDIVKGKRIYQRVDIEYPDTRNESFESKWRLHLSSSLSARKYNSRNICVTAQNVEDLKLAARAACILDSETGKVYYNVNMNEKRNQASTTKIVTAITVLEKLDDLSVGFTVPKEAAETAYSNLGEAKGDVIGARDLLKMALIVSDNGAAVTLAHGVSGSVPEFADAMEKTAKEMGCRVTCFQNPHGLDKRDHYSTAYEVALTLNCAMKNETFAEMIKMKEYHVMSYSVAANSKKKKKDERVHYGKDGKPLAEGEYEGESTNVLLRTKGILGGKTGFTGIAGYCYAGAYEYDGHRYITVVLGERSEKNRWKDTRLLMNYIRQNVAKNV